MSAPRPGTGAILAIGQAPASGPPVTPLRALVDRARTRHTHRGRLLWGRLDGVERDRLIRDEHARALYDVLAGRTDEGWDVLAAERREDYRAMLPPLVASAEDYRGALGMGAEPEEVPEGVHRVEQAVEVYLVLSPDGARWQIDPTTFDGDPLEGRDEDLHEGCRVAPAAVENPDPCDVFDRGHHMGRRPVLPTGEQLAMLLVRAFADHKAASVQTPRDLPRTA